MQTDLYAVLGVQRDASADEIRAAYRRLARKHHPDRGGEHAAMQAINAAYAVLSDQDKRARYDRGQPIDAAEQFDAMVHDHVAGLFNQALDEDVDRPVDHILKCLRRQRDAMSAELVSMRHAARRAEKAAGKARPRKKDAPIDLFAGVLAARLERRHHKPSSYLAESCARSTS